MRSVSGVVAALLLLSISLTGSAAAGSGPLVDALPVTGDASLRADDGVDAGAFIKPEAAPPSLTERPQESPHLMRGTDALDRRGSGPFSPTRLSSNEPAPLSASIRRAHLHVYRL